MSLIEVAALRWANHIPSSRSESFTRKCRFMEMLTSVASATSFVIPPRGTDFQSVVLPILVWRHTLYVLHHGPANHRDLSSSVAFPFAGTSTNSLAKLGFLVLQHHIGLRPSYRYGLSSCHQNHRVTALWMAGKLESN
jgi:hypothetical protein